jgi:hypothetical protein
MAEVKCEALHEVLSTGVQIPLGSALFASLTALL